MSGMEKKIAMVGGGNMAEAVIAGLLHKKMLSPQEIWVTEVRAERREYLEQKYGITTSDDNATAPRCSRTIFLAVKPQVLKDVKDILRGELTQEHLIISILAGQSRRKLGDALGQEARTVRVMPNLPAQVGRGISAITFPPHLSEAEKEWVRAILRSVGEIVEVEESLQDVVTAVSGSGPGYLFYLVEHWIAAAAAQGLTYEAARSLVTETLGGAAELLKHVTDTPAELVKKVATPGGTTEAGLSALREWDVAGALKEMVHRATERSKELNRS